MTSVGVRPTLLLRSLSPKCTGSRQPPSSLPARVQSEKASASRSSHSKPSSTQQTQMSDEKTSTSSSSASPSRSTYRQAHSFIPARLPPAPSSCPRSSYRYVRPRGLLIWNLFKKWSPVLAYGATSLGFVLAVAFWKTQVFDGE